MDVGLLDQNGLRVAGNAAGEGVGHAKRRAERQHCYGICPTNRGGKRGDGAAHDVPMRIALGHHAPGGLGRDEGGQRLEPAGLLDPRPQFPHGAELGDGQELVLVGGEAEIDEAARIVEGDTALLERAQISDGAGKRESEFLRLRTAGRMDHPAVGDSKGTGETLAREIGDKSGKDRRDVLPRQRAVSVQGHTAERAEAEADGAILRAKPARLDESGEKTSRVLRLHAEIEIDGDAGIEIDIVERGADRRAGRGKRGSRNRRLPPGTPASRRSRRSSNRRGFAHWRLWGRQGRSAA